MPGAGGEVDDGPLDDDRQGVGEYSEGTLKRDEEEENRDEVGEEEDEVDVDVDVDDDHGEEQPSPAPGTDDPFSRVASSGEYNTAAASTKLNTVNVELMRFGGLSSPASHPHACSIVSPRGKPTLTDEDTCETRLEEKTTYAELQNTPETKLDEMISSVEAASESGCGVVVDILAAELQIISTDVVQSPIPDVFKTENKDVKLTSTEKVELASESEGIISEVDPGRSKSNDPTSSMDDKIPEEFERKNSIQDSKLKVVEETQIGNEDVMGLLLSLQSQRSSSAQESLLKEIRHTEQDAYETGKQDQLLLYAADGRSKSEDDEVIRAVQVHKTISPKAGIGSSSKDDPNACAGLTTLSLAIDGDDAREQFTQFEPKLDNGRERAQKKLQKTELEREMELFEAAEREEKDRLLSSMRCGHSMQVDSTGAVKDGLGDTDLIMNDRDMMLNDRKRGLDCAPHEPRKKRGKRLIAIDDPKDEEDVCFICFDGGDLVLCDRRTCPKAYHLSCIGRDTAFFQKKGAWICGWHFCSICTKPATFQCYTCPTAYCSSCLHKADFHCVRQRKGLCEECWPIVKMIENKETVNAEGVAVDFTDQETYECLFKEYWVDLKLKLSFTPIELDKESGHAYLETVGSDLEDKTDAEDDSGGSDNGSDDHDEEDSLVVEEIKSKKLKRLKRGKSKALSAEETEVEADVDFQTEIEEEDVEEEDAEDGEEEDGEDMSDIQPREFDGWASKELIEFVKFMNEDPKKPLTRFQVTKLIWSYIKSEKLQDARKRTQIICDDRLKAIFGTKTVGQFDMFKHLQAHFAPKRRAGRPPRDEQTSMEADLNLTDGDATYSPDEKFNKVKDVKDKRRKKKVDDDKFDRPNVDEFAAISPKNIGLIYLRRQLLEELLDDPEFDSKVFSTFVRIRVPGMISKSEMCYRLVQVVGTRLQAEHYKAGRKTTNIVLEILNLQKREDVTVDLVSNHDFNEEECQRLRQSIKCGFIKTLTVGDIEEKARSLQEAKVNDWFETERQRLVNLRDRASEKGRKKELRECVEKLQELNSPAFRAAKLLARPEVTADPRMDPNYESDGNDDKLTSTAADGISTPAERSVAAVGMGEKILPVSILKNNHSESSKVDWDGQRMKHSTWADTKRNKEGDRGYDSIRSNDKSSYGRTQQYGGLETGSERGYDERDKGWEKEWGMDERDGGGGTGWVGNGRNRANPGEKWNAKVDSSLSVDVRSTRSDYKGPTGMTTPVFDTKSDWIGRREQAPPVASTQQGFPASTQNVLSQAAAEAVEKEKIWHYMDPTGTTQGPFAMEQLRKWNTTGYFPENLRIWKTDQARDESILLTDGLLGRFQKERESWSLTSRPVNPVVAGIQEQIAQVLNSSSAIGFNNSHPTVKSGESGDGWRDSGGATWTGRGAGDLGRSLSWGGDGGQSSRPLVRDAGSGQTASFRVSSDLKWKPGPAAGSYDSYGRSSFSSSPARRAEAAARFDPANWGSRSTSIRPERESWISPVVETGGFSKSGGRSSWGRGSSYRDSGGGWTPDGSGGHDSSRPRGSRTSKKDIICRFHQKGYCKRGEQCEYWHG